MKADMAELRMALRGMHDSGTGEASVLLFAALDELANYRALEQAQNICTRQGECCGPYDDQQARHP